MRAGGPGAGIGIQPLFIIRRILIIDSDPEKSEEYHLYTAMKLRSLGVTTMASSVDLCTVKGNHYIWDFLAWSL
jgi:hypothetical protein